MLAGAVHEPPTELPLSLHVPSPVQVLERKVGIPISLSAVYEGVARRLGVRLSPVSYCDHCHCLPQMILTN